MEKAGGGHRLPLTSNDQVPRRQCPICGSTARSHFRDVPYDATTSTHHFRCDACGLIYMDPTPEQDWYNRLYGDEFWEVKSVNAPSGQVWMNEKQWHKGLARAEKYLDLLRHKAPLASIKSVLEIGASFGLIGTTVANSYGAQAFGVEPNHAARDFASRVSVMTMVGETAADLDKWQNETPIDLAIFSHVLENIVDPRSALAAVHRKLRPGGLLLIEMSNSDTRPSMSIYHPFCFSAVSLRRLLAECGFRIEHEFCAGRPTSLVIPLYLTVLAEAVPAPVTLKKHRPPSTLTVKFRHLLYRVFYKSPLGELDHKICLRRSRQTAFVERGIGKLRASLGRRRAAPQDAL